MAASWVAIFDPPRVVDWSPHLAPNARGRGRPMFILPHRRPHSLQRCVRTFSKRPYWRLVATAGLRDFVVFHRTASGAVGSEPQALVGLPTGASRVVIAAMSTKSRQTIYGGSIMAAKILAQEARKAAEEAARKADREALWRPGAALPNHRPVPQWRSVLD